MDMDTAAAFLGTAILFSLGIVVFVIGFTVINNILHKYWKPVKLFVWSDTEPKRFMTEEEVKNHNDTLSK